MLIWGDRMKFSAEYVSTNIDWLTYDDKKLVLELSFKSGYLYTYTGVDEVTFREFFNSPSKGRAVHQLLGGFAFTKKKT